MLISHCRLNKVANTDVNPDQFEYEKEYITQESTEEKCEWSGFAFYARAKQTMIIQSGKQDTYNDEGVKVS